MFRKEQPIEMTEPIDVSDTGAEDMDLSGPIILDLADVRDEPVSKGWHAVRIERAEPKISRQKKLPQIFVLARITDEGDPEYNRTVIWNLTLKGDGLVFTKRCFVALGLPSQLDYPSYQALADDLIGLEVEAQVKHRVYEGNKQIQVSNWRKLTSEVAF